MNEKKHYIYHITHIENLKRIINDEKLVAKNYNNTDYKNIAHDTVQQMRSEKQIPIAPNGCLHDYVPFYFGMRSPMLFAISKNKVDGYIEGQRPIIYLVSSVEWCDKEKLRFVYTDGHAAIKLTSFYNDVKDLDCIDFNAVKANLWFDDHENIDRKRKKQAEFLVREQFPWNGIHGIVTIDQEIREQVIKIFNQFEDLHKPPIKVEPEWYYD